MQKRGAFCDRFLALCDKLLEVDQRLWELLQVRLQLLGSLLLLGDALNKIQFRIFHCRNRLWVDVFFHWREWLLKNLCWVLSNQCRRVVWDKRRYRPCFLPFGSLRVFERSYPSPGKTVFLAGSQAPGLKEYFLPVHSALRCGLALGWFASKESHQDVTTHISYWSSLVTSRNVFHALAVQYSVIFRSRYRVEALKRGCAWSRLDPYVKRQKGGTAIAPVLRRHVVQSRLRLLWSARLLGHPLLTKRWLRLCISTGAGWSHKSR